MNLVIVASSAPVTPREIIELQIRAGSEGWGIGSEAVWKDAIDRSMAVISARSGSTLVGVAFLIGNLRHGELTDVVVDPEYRRQGIGQRMSEEVVSQTKLLGIRYVSLIRDPSNPSLEAFYERVGFESIDFAMGLVNEVE